MTGGKEEGDTSWSGRASDVQGVLSLLQASGAMQQQGARLAAARLARLGTVA